ncbi:hypothetical protein C8F04DRAFT_1051258 [Mycena alexandri]|uniref:DUF7918 domain-containing protein n=1 Tax=Mycena alexandri TaxID=1745969 RepID=A0AAD6S2E9_9AGAR|nr:hypothetical protein C8F04DRAFT_1051258 [Mycena alexandri]
MPDKDGFSAWITTEGVKAEEFDVQTAESSKMATCWIPSEGGKKFSVHWSNLSVPGLTGGRVLVDGNNCDGQILAQKRRPTSTAMGGMNETTTSVRPFVFGALDITDDETVADLAYPDEGLGTIDLEIWRVDKNDAGPSTWRNLAIPAPKKIHERSKKAVTQRIGFSDSVDRPPAKVVSCRWTERLVTFSFKYRQLDLLRADGIAPPLRKGKRKAPPIPDCVLSDEDGLNSEEARLEAALRQLRDKRALKNSKKRKIKEEDEAELIDLARRKKRIKLEDTSNRPIFIPGEVIDLT